MAGNSIGTIFKLTTFGESHGVAIGGVIDGCPAGFELDVTRVQAELDRRKPGQSAITTQRKEADTVEFLSGLFEGKTTGTPIGFIIRNQDQRSKDYSAIKDAYRPSHADFTYDAKYGFRDYRGGGRSSARETACRVVAGSIAAQFLKAMGVSVNSSVMQTGEIKIPANAVLNYEITETNPVRCAHAETASAMLRYLEKIRDVGDTVGGIIHTEVTGVPAGWGEPVFDKLHADLGKAMLSINAVKGFEIGSGMAAASMRGSEHNDAFAHKDNQITTKTNRSGGIQGGISNGSPITFNTAFKPVATVMQAQETITKDGKETILKAKGRHDPCVVPRAVPIVDAMTALVLFDHALRQKTAKFTA